MKKNILYLIVFICFFVSSLFCGENKLAKISYKSYYNINTLNNIIKRYEKRSIKRNSRKNKKFLIPVNGYTFRKRIFKGLFIKPRKKYSKVISAQKGEVIFAGFLKYFGNVVIIRHKHGFTTTYAFLKRVSVSKGDYVYRGEKIGNTYKNQPIYFEIRRRAKCLTSKKYKKYIDNG